MIQKLFHFDKENPRSPWIFYIFYFVVYFGNAIQGSFLSVYLNEMGVQPATISLLNGILQLLSLVFLPIMGRLADNAPTKNMVMTIGYMITIFFLFMFTQVQSVLVICVLRILYGLMATPLMSIYETITFDSITKKGWEYQPIRMSGTIGFSIMALVSGYLLKGDITEEQLNAVKKYIINPVESREASFEKPETLRMNADAPADVAVLDGFTGLEGDALKDAVELLYGQALVAEGSPVPDPARFGKLLVNLMLGK